MAISRLDLVGEPSPVALTPMLRRHVRSVVHIEQQVYPQPWSANLFLSELALRASRDYTVAQSHQKVVGYAGLSYIDDEAHVTTIAVDPLYQGRSIATQLMVNNVRLCLERGVSSMTLEVRVSNAAAQALYRKFGFAPAGIRKNYYAHPTEDALIMWLYDMDSDTFAERLANIGGIEGAVS